MSGNDDYVNGTEAETFFNSISFKSAKTSQAVFTSPTAGFHVKFPQAPQIYENNYNTDGINEWQFEANDSTSGNTYAVYKKTVTNLNFIEEDSFDLSLIEYSLKSSEIISKEISRSFTKVDGYDALKMQFVFANGNFLHAEAILKGPHYFFGHANQP